MMGGDLNHALVAAGQRDGTESGGRMDTKTWESLGWMLLGVLVMLLMLGLMAPTR